MSINATARKTGFCKRLRKLNPKDFLEILLFKTFDSSKESLVDHLYELRASSGVGLRKQSLHDRFTPEAVSFVKALVEEQLSSKCFFSCHSFLETFSKVYVQDSTRFGLPEGYQAEYPSFKGGGGKAGAQIGFVYEVKGNKILSLDVSPATRNENLSSKGNDWIQSKSLVLRDLGYFSFDGLMEIAQKNAYFISRAKPKTAFTENGKRLDLKELVQKMKKNSISYLEKSLMMGCDRKVPVRAVFSLVPAQIEQKRLRKVNNIAKYRDYKVEEEYKVWAQLNVFITNVPAEMLKMERIPLLYRLRWQVELVFKTWKSHYKIHLHKSVKKERMECYLYGTLLLIICHWKIFGWLQALFWQQGILLSLQKFSKAMIHLNREFKKALSGNERHLNELLKMIVEMTGFCLEKERKNNNVGMIDILQLIEN